MNRGCGAASRYRRCTRASLRPHPDRRSAPAEGDQAWPARDVAPRRSQAPDATTGQGWAKTRPSSLDLDTMTCRAGLQVTRSAAGLIDPAWIDDGRINLRVNR